MILSVFFDCVSGNALTQERQRKHITSKAILQVAVMTAVMTEMTVRRIVPPWKDVILTARYLLL
jgi:hypothetical protein